MKDKDTNYITLILTWVLKEGRQAIQIFLINSVFFIWLYSSVPDALLYYIIYPANDLDLKPQLSNCLTYPSLTYFHFQPCSSNMKWWCTNFCRILKETAAPQSKDMHKLWRFHGFILSTTWKTLAPGVLQGYGALRSGKKTGSCSCRGIAGSCWRWRTDIWL
jgi:hypothetical protein